MTKLISFLTSKELLIACGVIGIACLLCLIIYYVEKSTEKRRRRHNTRELNKLVEEVKKEVPVEDTKVYNQTPVMEPIIINEEVSVSEAIDKTIEVKPIVEEKIEEKMEEPLIIEEIEVVPEDDVLEYTDIEPDQVTAQLELKKIREELERQESIEDTQNISLTNYEEEQEENAIISLEELVKKGKEIYDSNEEVQYMDEGNEPISLQELEQKVGRKAEENFNEPFIIENVVPEEVVIEEKIEEVKVVPTKVEVNHKFQTSPIISPIYGIEKSASINDLALENTANYEKLDAEIRRTNEFRMSLSDLQKEIE